MMRSLFSGVSGLKTHQTRMDVIGNNIANVNTTAFKSKNVNFSDMLYQTTQAASGPRPEAGTGGINAKQIGLGVKTAAINTTITQEGGNQSTGNPFDLKLTGEAFFVVSDGTNTYYTRDGAFNVDEAGNLCMASTGYIVQGWGVGSDGNIVQGSVGNLNVMSKSSYDPAATTKASVSGIIDQTDSALETDKGRIMNLQVLDKLGYEYNLQFGILPQTVVQSATRDIQNTESKYTLPQHLYKVDVSKLSYSYMDKDNKERILYDTEKPKLIDALNKVAWDVASSSITSGKTIPVTLKDGTVENLQLDISKYGIGKKGTTTDPNQITITINDAFLTKYGLDLLEFSALKGEDITVKFSGDVGYVTEKPTEYPVDSKKYSTISNDAVKFFYDGVDGAVKGGVVPCTISTQKNTGEITVIEQKYDEDDGTTTTKYTFKNKAGGNIDDASKATKLYADIMKIMNLVKPNATVDKYITREEVQTSKVDPGKYKVTLLGMSSYGQDVPIDNLTNGGTTSWELIYDASNGKFKYIGADGNTALDLALSNLDGKFSNVSIDWSDTTNVFNEGKSTTTALKDDGYAVGKLKGVSIAQDGLITAVYTNGMSATIGQICVGTFANAMGLQNSGDNLYSETENSGECRTVDIKASGTGYMTTGMLEMSNVDLSQEFTNMITTQRGFQANSRIITVSDGIIEELVNLKR